MRWRAPMTPFPSRSRRLRIASLAALRHPFSVDLYLEKVCARAKLVVVRVLGGADYWRYGVDELKALARRSDVKLALLPGDRRRDARLDEASTLDPDAVLQIWRYFDEGGPDNMAACLAFLASEIGAAAAAPPPVPVSAFGRFDAACFEAGPGAARALIVFYRSIYLANDLEPIEALARALRDKGFAVTSVFVTSLKDEAALAPLTRLPRPASASTSCSTPRPFPRGWTQKRERRSTRSTRRSCRSCWLESSLDAWRASQRGLGPSDLAMHVALPEIDGRILSRAISFKAGEPARRADRIRARSRIGRSPTASSSPPSLLAAGRASDAKRRRTNASLACCRIIRRAADAPATRSALIRQRAPSLFARLCAPRAMMWRAVWTRRHSSRLSSEGPLEAALTLAEYEAELASTPVGLPAILVRRVGRSCR